MAEPLKLHLARQQLARVQVASNDPVDWSDLALYAFYALENAPPPRSITAQDLAMQAEEYIDAVAALF